MRSYYMNKNKPLISVIMPAYNAEPYISAAIESVLAQTFKRFELIIIDDSSTDKTLTIIKSFAKKDKRIRVLANKADRNIGRVLNKGIDFARSNIIARMDADDVSLPHRFKEQFALLNSSKKMAVVGLNIEIIDLAGKHIAWRSYPSDSKEMKKCLLRYSPFAHPGVMFKKDMFEKVGKYNTAYSPTEDLDLWFRLGKRYSFGSIPKTLLQYRMYERSSSHRMIKSLEMMVFKIRFEAIRRYGYRPSVYDVVYNVLQFITLWFTPSSFRIKIYNLFRNNNLI